MKTTTKTTTTTVVAPLTTLTRHLFYSTFHSFTQTHTAAGTERERDQLFVYMQTIFHAHVHHISKCCCGFSLLSRSILAISASHAFRMTLWWWMQIQIQPKISAMLFPPETQIKIKSNHKRDNSWSALHSEHEIDFVSKISPNSARFKFMEKFDFSRKFNLNFRHLRISVLAFSTNFRNNFHQDGRFKMQWWWWR